MQANHLPAVNNLYVVWAYVFYILISVALTVWVARTLSSNGIVFLIDSFLGNERLAQSVNHLLVVGFYLINIGYVALALSSGIKPRTAVETVEFLSTKIGWVLVVLGVMHFFNMYVFNRMRRRAVQRHEAPPIAPSGFAAPQPLV